MVMTVRILLHVLMHTLGIGKALATCTIKEISRAFLSTKSWLLAVPYKEEFLSVVREPGRTDGTPTLLRAGLFHHAEERTNSRVWMRPETSATHVLQCVLPGTFPFSSQQSVK